MLLRATIFQWQHQFERALGDLDSVIAADGAITGWGGFGSIVFARSDQADFPARLHAAGALLLLEPSHLIFCGGTDRTPSASGDDRR